MNKNTFRTVLVFTLAVMILATNAIQVSASDAAAPKTKTPTPTPTSTGPTPTPGATTIRNIIPMPVSITSTGGSFVLPSTADIYVEPGTAELTAIGQYLANKLNPSTGYGLQVFTTTGAPANGNIYLTTVGGDPTLGDEGYQLTVTSTLVTIVAYRPAGLFRGLQTIRQMFPAEIEGATLQPGPWKMATGTVRDYPRFAWRGSMLDVARHFFPVADVKRYIDLMAYYKLNVFHFHLSDDQGWRIMINSWPNLATYGGGTQVGGSCTNCYYTQAQYSDIVAYAQSRYITLVPEIDMPGHTNAALASYAELNCNGVAPARYTGTNVGFSSLCISKPITYTFVDDVIRELAALTPGAYIHVGGDEASSTATADYVSFISQVQTIVQAHGKQMIGWEEVAQINGLSASSVAQHWNTTDSFAPTAVQKGSKVLMSPANKAYLDMKYYRRTSLGQTWAGLINTQTGYEWDPATIVSGVSASSVLGVEAPLWTETIVTMADIEYMAYPRLPGYAELGWSPVTGRNWSEYKVRLGSHGPRLTTMGVNFYRDTLVPWQ